MANYKAVANGNWSNLAIWQDNSSGSFVASTVLPGASDVVYFNNFTVQMDVDVTVLEIRNNSATGVTQGGSGVISTSRTVNADLYHSAGTTLISVIANTPDIVTFVGDMPGSATSVNSSRGIGIGGDVTVNYIGDIFAGSASGVYGTTGIQASNGVLNITGNVIGGTNNGSAPNTAGVRASSGTINIVGNVYATTIGGRDNYGIASGTGVINITGQVYGSPSAISPYNAGIQLGNSTSTLIVVGGINAANGSSAIYGPLNSSSILLYGNATNSINGTMAAIVSKLFIESTSQWEFRKSNLTTNTLYTPGVATGHPAEANVRTGITYGPTNNLTGTCAVPPANTVSLGVPVDNTVGTAQLDTNALAASLTSTLAPALDASLSVSLDASLSASLPAAIAPLLWDEDVANLTTPNSIGERVKNCATVATTGAQIASFNP